MPRCRPFKLIDAMILIATAALGMASRKGIPWHVHAVTVHAGLTVALLMLTVAYVWIRLIPPRLPTSDLIRQPGMLSLVLLIGLAFLYLALSAFVSLVAGTNMIIALALGLSWGAACRRYRSRAESGWIEGLGRSVGVGLVVSIAASYPWYLLAF